MERTRAAALTEDVLTRLVELQDEWPLNLVTAVYVYGSFARGAPQPHDVDLDVEFDQSDERWISTVIRSLTNGRDPAVEFRKLLVGRKRGVEFAFNNREEADYDTLLWQRGEDLETGLARVRAIQPDPSAGRAQRDAMLPEFEGLDVLCGARRAARLGGPGRSHRSRTRLVRGAAAGCGARAGVTADGFVSPCQSTLHSRGSGRAPRVHSYAMAASTFCRAARMAGATQAIVPMTMPSARYAAI